jgi:diguanylate cyclase (GGDEF)-like protein
VARDGQAASFESYLPALKRHLRISIIPPFHGQIAAVFEDITDRKDQERQLEHQATHDALTGLANRTLLADRLRQTLLFAERSGRIVAVLLLDMDRFKVINDSLGHSRGDELLQQIAARLEACVRGCDTVARLGGDEFVVLLAEVAEIDDVGLLAKRITDSLARPYQLAERELRLTASIGISLFPRDGVDDETLIRHADSAMYRAKEEGGGSFAFFSPEMNLRAQETLEIEADLHRGLERGEFLLHYQPAEETGLIVPLGVWVLQEACTQARAWQKMGLPPVKVAVNLSARQFRQPHLAEQVQEALGRSGFEPGMLQLELTESAIMHDPAGSAETMQRLKKLGIGMLLDDFGTGYSSLQYLRRFPVNGLKIDRSFIADATADASGAAVVTSVIAIAHSLGMIAVAEGVETWDQYDFVSASRCDALQGYLFSPPVPPADFAELLLNGKRLIRPRASLSSPPPPV